MCEIHQGRNCAHWIEPMTDKWWVQYKFNNTCLGMFQQIFMQGRLYLKHDNIKQTLIIVSWNVIHLITSKRAFNFGHMWNVTSSSGGAIYKNCETVDGRSSWASIESNWILVLKKDWDSEKLLHTSSSGLAAYATGILSWVRTSTPLTCTKCLLLLTSCKTPKSLKLKQIFKTYLNWTIIQRMSGNSRWEVRKRGSRIYCRIEYIKNTSSPLWDTNT